MKLISIIGARPQFVKAAMVSHALHDASADARERSLSEILIHTGQHYDYQMSQVFFDQLDIPEPNYHLNVGSASHGEQTGRMLSEIEKVLMDEQPDAVLVYGDTNSTIAGALAAAKLHIPVGHIEGGMRSFNRRMPEEINRVLTDHIATWHFCATETAVKNLKHEGVTEGVHLVGDVMHDAVIRYKDVAREKSQILDRLGLATCKDAVELEVSSARKGGEGGKQSYALATIHRAENTDDHQRLKSILKALAEISKKVPVLLPLHPRTLKQIDVAGFAGLSRVAGMKCIDPLPYLDILQLEQHASVILTDSGGMQKEAFWQGVPCVTMRDETEWVETVEAGMNQVVGADTDAIVRAFNTGIAKGRSELQPHGEGELSASETIIAHLLQSLA